jgi:hypothetical protein
MTQAHYVAETFPQNRLDALLRLIVGINHGRKRPLILANDTGMYCIPGYPVQFTFTVTGGTGTYRHASGGGTIAVGPARNSPPTATEFWSGTIHQS